MIPKSLKARLTMASAGGAFAIAWALMGWFEGRVYTPYLDPAGVLTVCEGHTGPDIIPGKQYTDAECDALKAADLAKAEAAVDRLVKVPVDKWQKAALIDFTINKGPGNLSTSTLLRKTNAGDYTGACQEYKRWVKARVHGVLTTLKGLVNRSLADEWVCAGGVG